MPSSRLEWNGDKITARLLKATKEAIDEATAEAAADMRANHWWTSRTGNLDRQIVTEKATVEGSTVTGQVGATYYGGRKGKRSGFYGLFLEYKLPWIRPAGDRVFPTLASKISRRFAA